PRGSYYQLTSVEMILPPVVGDAARRAFANDDLAQAPQEVFTYMANLITRGEQPAGWTPRDGTSETDDADAADADADADAANGSLPAYEQVPYSTVAGIRQHPRLGPLVNRQNEPLELAIG